MVISLLILLKAEAGMSTISSSLKSKWPLWNWNKPALVNALSEITAGALLWDEVKYCISTIILSVPFQIKGCRKWKFLEKRSL